MTARRRPPIRIAATAAAGAIGLSIATTARADGDDPAAVARDVFQGPDFWWKRIETTTVPTSWIESVLKAIGDLLAWIFGGLGDLLGRILRAIFGSLLGGVGDARVVLWLVLAMVLAWAAWRLYPVIAQWLQGRARAPAGAGADWLTLPEPADLLDRAGRAFGDGLYAEAIRLSLLALIARLEKRGLLRYDTSRTNREYQRELRHDAGLAADFGRLARIYERVWYGGMPAGRDEAERALGLCRSMIAGEGLAPE